MLALIVFFDLAPIALVAQVVGRDELLLKRRNVEPYWVDRVPAKIGRNASSCVDPDFHGRLAGADRLGRAAQARTRRVPGLCPAEPLRWRGRPFTIRQPPERCRYAVECVT